MQKAKSIKLPSYMKKVISENKSSHLLPDTCKAIACSFLEGRINIDLHYFREDGPSYTMDSYAVEILKESHPLYNKIFYLNHASKYLDSFIDWSEWDAKYGNIAMNKDKSRYENEFRNTKNWPPDFQKHAIYIANHMNKIINLAEKINERGTKVVTEFDKLISPPFDGISRNSIDKFNEMSSNTLVSLDGYIKKYNRNLRLLKSKNEQLYSNLYSNCEKASELGLFPEMVKEKWEHPNKRIRTKI